MRRIVIAHCVTFSPAERFLNSLPLGTVHCVRRLMSVHMNVCVHAHTDAQALSLAGLLPVRWLFIHLRQQHFLPHPLFVSAGIFVSTHIRMNLVSFQNVSVHFGILD